MSELVLIANAGDGTISTLRLDRSGPRLEPLATSGELPGCGTFAIDRPRGLVYAAAKGDPPVLATLRLDEASGVMEEVARRPVGGSLTYVSLAHDGRFLLGVSYGAGRGWVWPLTDGVVGEPVAEFSYRNLHCVVVEGEQVYAVSLGEDLIAQFTLSAAGVLAPCEPLVVDAPRGCGPRHLVLDGPSAYVVTEFTGQVLHYARAGDGTLTLMGSLDTVPPGSGLQVSAYGKDPKAEPLIWGADIHRAGPWLLTSERSSSTIATTALTADGALGQVTAYTSVPRQPRGFAVTADGEYVVAVGERATEAALLRVGADGTLRELDRAGIGAGANWVRILS